MTQAEKVVDGLSSLAAETVPSNVHFLGHLDRSIQAPTSSPAKRVDKWDPVIQFNPLLANELAPMAVADLVPLFAFTRDTNHVRRSKGFLGRGQSKCQTSRDGQTNPLQIRLPTR